MINYQLTQLITDSTRVSSNSNSLIDVFITNSSESIISSGVYPLSISDHDLIYAIRKTGLPKGNRVILNAVISKTLTKNNLRQV